MPDSPSQRPPSTEFPTTHWSRVLTAGDPSAPEARAALDELCAAYWYPIYAFIRRRGSDADAAADLTQGFFTLMIDRGMLSAADPSRGRFLRVPHDRLWPLPDRPIPASARPVARRYAADLSARRSGC